MIEELNNYRKEMYQELNNILGYWMKYTVDLRNGGFIGRIDNDNNIDEIIYKNDLGFNNF